MKLLKIIKSPNPKKKWRAIFDTKHTDFGDSSAEDYTQHKDESRRAAYRSRHKKDLQTNDPTRAGFLSYYILWGDSTDFQTNVRSYRQRFGL